MASDFYVSPIYSDSYSEKQRQFSEHTFPDVLADFGNGVKEHVVNHIGFQPFLEPFDDVELRIVRRQKNQLNFRGI
ncbi:hypothetical protein B1222_14595 [Paenibacillus larvae subsp. pulvifaciens]|nr:hypothetical protein B1222_14595 [Paenibacillus larvae subsp. pulvifaciens]AQZ47357.1 hypothetical protein B5S25_12940 [Paenibacillus larvae subsp. pulvifaciens]